MVSTLLNFTPSCKTEAEHLQYSKAVHQFFHHGEDKVDCTHEQGIGEEELKKSSTLYVFLHKIYDKEDTEDQDCASSIITDFHLHNNDNLIVDTSSSICSKALQLLPFFGEQNINDKEIIFPYQLENLKTNSLRGPPHLFA